MNRYQEALDELCDHAMEYEEDYDWDENPCGDYVSLNKEHLKELKEPLQELVDKATPKKPIKKYYITSYGNNGRKKRLDIRCSCCNSAFTNGIRSSVGVYSSKEADFINTVNNQKFCMFCGQAIDWSDEDG